MSQQPLSEPIAKTREINDVRALPVLPVRDTVLFPHAVLPLTVAVTKAVSVKRVRNRIRILRRETGIAASQKLHRFEP